MGGGGWTFGCSCMPPDFDLEGRDVSKTVGNVEPGAVLIDLLVGERVRRAQKHPSDIHTVARHVASMSRRPASSPWKT